MKSVSTALAAHLNGMVTNGASAIYQFDLYTITTTTGLRLAYTTADFAIYAADATVFDPQEIDGSGPIWSTDLVWSPFVIDEQGGRTTASWKPGLNSDTWQATFSPGDTDLIDGMPWLYAVATGALDDADCVVSRAYFATMPTWAPDAQYSLSRGPVSPLGTITLFRGYLGEFELTTSAVRVTVNDYRQMLQANMPRNFYGAACRHRFGDARCGVNLAAVTASGVASATSGRMQVVAASAIAAPSGSATFDYGILTMTTGVNAGQERLIRSWTGGTTFSLLSPLPFDVAAGDAFSVTAGCNKTMAHCAAFANLANFGGDPFIPIPETTLA